jgi:preprotein translocase subunit SecD
MKTLTKLFFIIFPFLLLYCSGQKPKTLILQATGAGISNEQLTRASGIISNRFKNFGIQISTTPEPDKSQIRIEIPDSIKTDDIKNLLTIPGHFGFYKTLLVNSNAKLACSTFEDKQLEDSLKSSLGSNLNGKNYRLVWSLPDSHSVTCIYALETNGSGNPNLDQSDVESANFSKNDSSQFYKIDIKFKSASAENWTSLTRSSVGKPVAIVIDDHIIYNPVVRDPIEGGWCEITGNFTREEANYFTAIINSGPLPVSLSLLPD